MDTETVSEIVQTPSKMLESYEPEDRVAPELPSYAGAALARTPIFQALLLITLYWFVSTAIVLLAVRMGGAAGALTAVCALLALYGGSSITVFLLRRYELNKVRDLVEVLNNTTQRLADLSVIDELTRIHNRRYFYWQLDKELERARRYGTPFALILFDIDNLKSINDGLGHVAGDRLLQIFSNVLCDNVRGTDVCARIGGDEFAVLAVNTPYESAHILAQRVSNAFADTPVDLSPDGMPGKAVINGSVTWGISSYTQADHGGGNLDAADIISWADQDLNAHKIEKYEAQNASRRAP